MSDELFDVLNEPKKEIAEMTKQVEQKYRHVFVSSPLALEVLADVLVSFCHFGCFLENEYERAQHNVGVNILSRCGIFKPGNTANVIKSMVTAIPTKTKEE